MIRLGFTLFACLALQIQGVGNPVSPSAFLQKPQPIRARLKHPTALAFYNAFASSDCRASLKLTEIQRTKIEDLLQSTRTRSDETYQALVDAVGKNLEEFRQLPTPSDVLCDTRSKIRLEIMDVLTPTQNEIAKRFVINNTIEDIGMAGLLATPWSKRILELSENQSSALKQMSGAAELEFEKQVKELARKLERQYNRDVKDKLSPKQLEEYSTWLRLTTDDE